MLQSPLWQSCGYKSITSLFKYSSVFKKAKLLESWMCLTCINWNSQLISNNMRMKHYLYIFILFYIIFMIKCICSSSSVKVLKPSLRLFGSCCFVLMSDHRREKKTWLQLIKHFSLFLNNRHINILELGKYIQDLSGFCLIKSKWNIIYHYIYPYSIGTSYFILS